MTDNVMEKAADSGSLTERSVINKKYGTADFDKWSNELITSMKFNNVLDICCGTGNQLVIYASIPSVETMAGVDISKESLAIAEKRITNISSQKKLELKCIAMEEMFNDPLIDRKYDLISCFYGLYYSQDIKTTLSEIIRHLSEEGHILIVGPYGDNNKNLFDVLTKYYDLPELVTRSSSTFMVDEVVPYLSSIAQPKIFTFENKIIYPNVEAVMTYWKSSTFYSPDYETVVYNDLNEIISRTGQFIMEKHIMSIIWRKS